MCVRKTPYECYWCSVYAGCVSTLVNNNTITTAYTSAPKWQQKSVIYSYKDPLDLLDPVGCGLESPWSSLLLIKSFLCSFYGVMNYSDGRDHCCPGVSGGCLKQCVATCQLNKTTKTNPKRQSFSPL